MDRPASVAPTQATLSWTRSTDNVGIAGYYVYRGTTRRTATTNAFTDTGLTPSTTYAYSVAAFDRAGNLSARPRS
jgi:chitodextrinase